MPQITLSGIVRRRFVHCVNHKSVSARQLVERIGLPPVTLCKLVANQNTAEMPLHSFALIANWLQMPLVNVALLGGKQPTLHELVSLGMEARGCTPTSTGDQEKTAREIGISVAVFRRALHNYDSFRPSIRTCDRLAGWLSWTGFDSEDIASAAGMIVRYLDNGRRITITPKTNQLARPYPCACNRPGCMIPPHIPKGPHRKWRSDACRMWVKRRDNREVEQLSACRQATTPLPQDTPIVRFITINERPVPVRF